VVAFVVFGARVELSEADVPGVQDTIDIGEQSLAELAKRLATRDGALEALRQLQAAEVNIRATTDAQKLALVGEQVAIALEGYGLVDDAILAWVLTSRLAGDGEGKTRALTRTQAIIPVKTPPRD
jgi:hypothetical protein